MSKHSFHIEIAKELGVNKAILFDHLMFWIDFNSKTETNYYDGKYWTYNTIKKIIEVFPYLSAKQISKAFDDLENDGYIETGNYNKIKYDRTKWYTITKKGFDYYVKMTNQYFEHLENAIYQKVKCNSTKGKMEDDILQNGYVENVITIPDTTQISTKYKTDSNNLLRKSGEFDLSFIHENIRESVKEFIDFRKAIKEPFRTQAQIQTFYNRLEKLSNKSFETAKEILEKSIANGWQGIFELNKKQSSSVFYDHYGKKNG